jgi:hypothetical protein
MIESAVLLVDAMLPRNPLHTFSRRAPMIAAQLSFLAPFFWYGTNKRAREISEKMTVLIELQRRVQRRSEPPLGHDTIQR